MLSHAMCLFVAIIAAFAAQYICRLHVINVTWIAWTHTLPSLQNSHIVHKAIVFAGAAIILLTVDMSDGVSSIGSIIDDGWLDFGLKLVSFVMIL